MKRVIRATALLLAASAIGASAQVAPAPVDDALFRSFGGHDGLARLMDDFMRRLLSDRRMSPFFKDVNQQQVKDQLVVQLCELSGGPCRLKGPGMRKVHDGMDITRADFNALVEVLQQAMDAQGIPFSDQNRLLAKLAPMHREIVNTP